MHADTLTELRNLLGVYNRTRPALQVAAVKYRGPALVSLQELDRAADAINRLNPYTTPDSVARELGNDLLRLLQPPRAPGGQVKAIGGNVKALSSNRFSVLGVAWGGSDLVGDTFVRGTTDLGAGRSFVGMPVFYDHAQGDIKSQIGQVVYADETDAGLVFTVELDRAERYLDEIHRLVRAKKMGSSTGALGHTVVRRAGKLLRWHIGELSLTPTPAEPRTMGRVVLV